MIKKTTNHQNKGTSEEWESGSEPEERKREGVWELEWYLESFFTLFFLCTVALQVELCSAAKKLKYCIYENNYNILR